MRIGLDVGGTNTDAVLLDGTDVIAKVKTPTTPDVTDGIVAALRSVLASSGADSTAVTSTMIGTTHFTNAVIARRGLARVAAIRLAFPATQALPPTVDWPADLVDALQALTYILHGGQEFDGRAISDIDDAELDRVADDLRREEIQTVAITSVFSPIDGAMERYVGEYLLRTVADLDITFSHEIGRIGLLERENATILNACLRPLARRTIAGFERAVADLDLRAALYLTQNDGTLMAADFAQRYPVLTFSSGPTNSMRGAGFLSGLEEALVIDLGGTTTDVGALTRGFPREASLAVDVGGVRTNFRMPDVLSIGLGGGSLVRPVDGSPPTVGPDSVGYELTQRAQIFGGSELTATDIAVAAGHTDLGDKSKVVGLASGLVDAATARIHEMVDEAVDRVRTSPEPLPMIVVGGGRILIKQRLTGASKMVVPEHYEVANAIGAAIAHVSGEVDRVVSLAGTTREAALDLAKNEAVDRAIAAGADPDTVRVIDAEDVPLTYLPGNASRVRVKVVGDLAETPGAG